MEKLSRLNAKTQSFSDSGGGYGSMSVSDLAACLAGCNPIGELILRRRYVDKKERGLGFAQLQRQVTLKIYEADKQPSKKDMIHKILDVALDDYIGGHVCHFCQGRKEIITEQGKVHKCRSKNCVDGFITRRPAHLKAKAMGVSAKEWERHYKGAYRVIEQYLTLTLPELESAAYNHVKKRANWSDVAEL